MGTLYGLVIMAFMALLLIAAMRTRKRIINETIEELAERENSFTLFIKLNDDGPAVSKIIVNANYKEGHELENFTDQDFTAESFKLSSSREGVAINTGVKKAYPCNIDGQECPKEEADHILLELESEQKGFDMRFCRINHKNFDEEVKEFNDFFCPEADRFLSFKTYTNIDAAYRLPYTEDFTSSKKFPLIVFIAKANLQDNGLYYELIRSGAAKISNNAFILFIQGKDKEINEKMYKKVIKEFIKKNYNVDRGKITIQKESSDIEY